MEEKECKRIKVDMFAKEHINDERTVKFFTKYVALKIGWCKDDERNENSLKLILKKFLKDYPALEKVVEDSSTKLGKVLKDYPTQAKKMEKVD